jgi:hypothetical protein
MLGLNVQPRTFAHHSFVAIGSVLASSVWVIQPFRLRADACFDGRLAARFGARLAVALSVRARGGLRGVRFLGDAFRRTGFFAMIASVWELFHVSQGERLARKRESAQPKN